MMKRKIKNDGLTLTELVVAVAILMLLAGIGIPAAKELFKSFETADGLTSVISAAMSNARAIAATEHEYAGIRFQRDINGNQYIIFIICDPAATGLANGFRAVAGRKPVKLPVNIGVMDLKLGTAGIAGIPGGSANMDISDNTHINDIKELNDTTTFSIVFSPGGSLVIHEVRVGRKSGNDDMFNTMNNVENDIGMFYQDDYDTAPTDLGLGQELSRNSFVIYQKDLFNKVAVNRRWTDYLQDLKATQSRFINPYTGQIVSGQ